MGPSPPENCANASLTWAWAMRTTSGPSLRTVSSITPGRSAVRSTASSSAGGPRRSPSPGPSRAAKAPTAARTSSSGMSPATHAGIPLGRVAVALSTSGHHVEEPLPAQLGELGLVGVEHVAAGMREAPLEDPALALAQHHGVGQLRRPLRRPGREVVEKVAVQVEGVDEVVLEDVDEIDADELVLLGHDGLLHVGEADRVGRVDLVNVLEYDLIN